jgi:hypothetical protein
MKKSEKKSKNGTKIIWKRCFRLKQLMTYPNPRLPSVSIVGIGGGPDAFLVTDGKAGIGYPIPTFSSHCIVFGCHQSPNVPGQKNNQSKK